MRSAVLGILLAALWAGHSQAEQEPASPRQDAPAAGFVSLKLEGSCGDANRRLWLLNIHAYRSIATTVRWRAEGGKDLTAQFFPGPGSSREIGCAAEAQIIQAVFVEF